MIQPSINYKRHRFPPEIIAHAVWLYVRFNLSLREVEEMMLKRGIDVSYETVRRWTRKFGSLIAHNLRRRQARPGDVWHLDEVVVKIAGRSFWLWRAVDQDGVVLDEILQPRRDERAAKRLLVRLMKRWGFVPRRIITDKLRSYGAAKRDVAPGLDHWSHKGFNNRAEKSHLPLRERERTMQRFRSPGGIATLRLHALRNPRFLLRPSPPPRSTCDPLPPIESIRGMENRGQRRFT